MTKILKETKDHDKARHVICAFTLDRARRRYAGHEIPVTDLDEKLTAETIYDLTSDLELDTRLCLLTSAIGDLVAGTRPFEDRARHLVDVPRLLRAHVEDLAKIPEHCKQRKKNGGKRAGGPIVSDGFIDPSDILLGDAAFDRAFRRRAGENLEITKDDIDGTFALIRQLMTGIDWIVLIIVTAKAIVEESDGLPQEDVMTQLEGLIRKIVVESDTMNLTFDGRMN